jgi:tetratricopeptide (TPR) repeat protein
MERGITEDELRELFRSYLQRRRPHDDPTDERFLQGLAWALHPVSSSAALVFRRDEDGRWVYRAFDYVVDYADRPDCELDPSARAVPAATWNFALKHSSLAEADVIGFSAYFRRDVGTAERAWRQAAASEGSAAFNLGVLLQQAGDQAGAEAAWRAGMELGDGDAAFNLGLLLKEVGDRAGAEAAFGRAAKLGFIPE